MMSLTQPHRQALGAIADGLAGSDPRLASMLTIFSRLAAGEEMPAREKTRARRRRPAAHRPRRARRRPRRGTVFPQPRRPYPRLSRPQAILLLWAVISAAVLAVALALNTSPHKTCIRPMGTACPSPSTPQHADGSQLMNLRLLAEAFRTDNRQALEGGTFGGRTAHSRAAGSRAWGWASSLPAGVGAATAGARPRTWAGQRTW